MVADRSGEGRSRHLARPIDPARLDLAEVVGRLVPRDVTRAGRRSTAMASRTAQSWSYRRAGFVVVIDQSSPVRTGSRSAKECCDRGEFLDQCPII